MNYNDMKMLASELVKSGLAPRDIRNQSQAFVVMVAGSELGIAPMTAIREVVLVKGKVTISSQMMLALAKTAGVAHEWASDTNDLAELILTRKGDKPYRSSFSMSDARSAGLSGSLTYKKFPRAMLRARCVSAAVRAYCPDVLSGVYVHGELDGDIDAPAPEARPEEKEPSFTIQKLEAWLKEHKLSTDIIDSWLVSIGGKPTTAMDMSTIGTLVERLNGNEDKLTQLKEYAARVDGESADEEVPF